jgi:murein tripeptide amidase MpaA
MDSVTTVGNQGINPYQFFPTFACLLTTFQDRDRVKSYDGYKVLRVNISNEKEFESIKNIYLSEDYDFWSPPTTSGQTDIMISPEQVDTVTSYLNFLKISYEIIYNNLEDNVNYEKYNSVTRDAGSMNWQMYQSVETIHGWMDSMAQQYPALVSVFNFGNSTEGRPMKVMKISTAGPSSTRPAVWIDGGIHAREWISPATTSYIANELILQATRRRVHRFVDSLDWYIAPLMNPDGYAYTMTADRFWRKTRSYPKRQIFGGIFGCCRGADPNRNWNYQWGGKGTSMNQCSPIYHGVKAASEPEVSSAQDFIMERKDQIKLFLTFHSYSQILLLPWGYDNKRSDDYDELMAVGNKAIKALEAVSGTKYTAGATAEILYAAAGGSFDWAKGVAGIKYAYAFELRDTGRFGFLLPAYQIIPSGKETFAAVRSMADDIMKIYRVQRFQEREKNSTLELFEQ